MVNDQNRRCFIPNETLAETLPLLELPPRSQQLSRVVMSSVQLRHNILSQHKADIGTNMKPPQAAIRLVEELEATFDFEVSSGGVTDRTGNILHRTKDVLNSLMSSHETQTFKVQQLDQELDMAVKSRLSFESIGSMSMWPASHTSAAVTLEHLVLENKELRQKLDNSQATVSFTKLLKECGERTTLYVAPDAKLAEVCNLLEIENKRQADHIISLSAELSGNDSADNATEAAHKKQKWESETEDDLVATKQQGTPDLSSVNQIHKASKGLPKMTDWGEPVLDTSHPEDKYESEGKAAQIPSQHASQAVPRSAIRMTTPSASLCSPPVAGFHPASLARAAEGAQQPFSCQLPSMAEPEAYAPRRPKDEPKAKQAPLRPDYQCLQHPTDSYVDQFPQHLPHHTYTTQAMAPWDLNAQHPKAHFSYAHYGPPPHLAASHNNSFGGQSYASNREDDYPRDHPSQHPSDYPYQSSYHHDFTASDRPYPNGTGGQSHCAIGSNSGYQNYPNGCSYRSSYDPTETYAHDTGFAAEDGYYGPGEHFSDAHQSWHIDQYHDYDDFHCANYDYSTYSYSNYEETGPTWDQYDAVHRLASPASLCDQAYAPHHSAGHAAGSVVQQAHNCPQLADGRWSHAHAQQPDTAFQSCIEMEMVPNPIHAASSAHPASRTANNSRLAIAIPAEAFEFPCADLAVEAETPRLFLHSAGTAATGKHRQHIQAECARLNVPADASRQSCVPQGSSNSQPLLFFGVDFANISTCEATAQQASWGAATSAMDDSLAEQSSEQPQEISKDAHESDLNSDIIHKFEGVAGSDEPLPAHQCNSSCTDSRSSFISFGLNPATLEACSATAQQASWGSAISAAQDSLAEQPSEQQQDTSTSNAADQSGSNTEVSNDLQGVAGSATQWSPRPGALSAHQCDNNFNITDSTTSFSYFGLEPAMLGVHIPTAQQASTTAASSAAEIMHAQQASTVACDTQDCGTQRQSSPPAVSSTPSAAQEAASTRARPSTALSRRRRRRHRGSTQSAAAPASIDSTTCSAPGDTSCQAAPAAQGSSSSCGVSSASKPSVQRPHAAAARHASNRSRAQRGVHRPALPAGQAATSPQPTTIHGQAGTAASLAVRHGHNGKLAMDGRPPLGCTDRQPTASVQAGRQTKHRSPAHQHVPAAVALQNAQTSATIAAPLPGHGKNHARNVAYKKRRRQRMQGSASEYS